MVPIAFFSEVYTIGDTGKPLEYRPVILVDVDLQCQTNPAYYGSNKEQSVQLFVDETLSYRTSVGLDLREIWFKNLNAGNNATIHVAGILKE